MTKTAKISKEIFNYLRDNENEAKQVLKADTVNHEKLVQACTILNVHEHGLPPPIPISQVISPAPTPRKT